MILFLLNNFLLLYLQKHICPKSHYQLVIKSERYGLNITNYLFITTNFYQGIYKHIKYFYIKVNLYIILKKLHQFTSIGLKSKYLLAGSVPYNLHPNKHKFPKLLMVGHQTVDEQPIDNCKEQNQWPKHIHRKNTILQNLGSLIIIVSSTEYFKYFDNL